MSRQKKRMNPIQHKRNVRNKMNIKRLGNQRWTRIKGMSTSLRLNILPCICWTRFWEAFSPLWTKFICHPPSLSHINKSSCKHRKHSHNKHLTLKELISPPEQFVTTSRGPSYDVQPNTHPDGTPDPWDADLGQVIFQATPKNSNSTLRCLEGSNVRHDVGCFTTFFWGGPTKMGMIFVAFPKHGPGFLGEPPHPKWYNKLRWWKIYPRSFTL